MKSTPREVFLSMLRVAYGREVESRDLALHQKTAVSRIVATLERRRGAILADEVGLGKSWVAAAVARAMRARGIDAEWIVPTALVSQWRETLQRFALDDPIETHDALARRDAYPGADGERLIVVDEAHRFRNPATKRYRALALRSVGHRLLLVTATPLSNAIADLAALVRLIAADDELAFEGVDSLERAFGEGDRRAMTIAFEELVVRRGRASLDAALGFGALERRVVRYPIPGGNAAIATGIESLEFPLIARAPERPLVRGILWRRLESSDSALADTLRRQSRFYRRARESLQNGFAMTKRDYLHLFGDDDAEPIQELLFPGLWLPSASGATATQREIDAEIERIERLQQILKRDDEKLAALEAWLERSRGEPMLLFTGSIATALHLFRSLRASRAAAVITSRYCAVGDERPRRREEVLGTFLRGGVALLLSTDVGAEGLNLQRARWVVHYDLPWNPVKLDQRNGRAWRIGQSARIVRAVYFIPESRASRAVLFAIAAKNRLRRAVVRDTSSIVDDALSSPPAVDCRGLAPPRPGRPSLLLARLSARIVVVSDSPAHWSELVETIASSPECTLAPISDAWRDVAARIERTLSARLHLAPRLRVAEAQAAMWKRIAALGWGDREMSHLLSRRYRAGVEIALCEMAAEVVSEATVRSLRELLTSEAPAVTEVRLEPISAIAIDDQRAD